MSKPLRTTDYVADLRRAAALMFDAEGAYEDRIIWYRLGEHLSEVAERHKQDPDLADLTLHTEEPCPTGECEDPGYHEGCLVCFGCYPTWDGEAGRSLFPCVELQSAHKVARAYLDHPQHVVPEATDE